MRLESFKNNRYTILRFLINLFHDFDVTQYSDGFFSCHINKEAYNSSVFLGTYVRLTSTTDGREQNMPVIQHTLRRTLEQLESVQDSWFTLH